MAAFFHDAPLIHDEDAVGAPDRGEAVCDDERGAPFRSGRNRLLDEALALTVEG